jgi:hypothetical protein
VRDRFASVLLIVFLAGVLPATAQEAAPASSSPVRVFIDCAGFHCDSDFFRTEITFVDHVRDRKDADVHVLATAEQTGSGGRLFTLKFIGLGRFTGTESTLTHAAAVTDTSDADRKALTQLLKLGLVRYAAESPVGSTLKITYTPVSAQSGSQDRQAGRDPWNFWVFRMSGNGFFNGQESTSSRYLSASASANRTTEQWKINLSFSGSDEASSYDLGDGSIFNNVVNPRFGSSGGGGNTIMMSF